VIQNIAFYQQFEKPGREAEGLQTSSVMKKINDQKQFVETSNSKKYPQAFKVLECARQINEANEATEPKEV